MGNRRIQNEARRAALSGRPCLHPYRTPTDRGGLVDKKTFQRMYETKWGGAPWMEDSIGGAEIVLDLAPASSPSCSLEGTPSSSLSTSQTSSRRTTLDDVYRSG
jgi:hypothetical protein